MKRSVSNFEVEYSCRLHILVNKTCQDGRNPGSRVIAYGFYDLGFDVDVVPVFSTPGDVGDLAANFRRARYRGIVSGGRTFISIFWRRGMSLG